MTNKFRDIIEKISKEKNPTPLNSEEDFKARRQVSEDMAQAKREYAVKSFNSQVSASKVILNSR